MAKHRSSDSIARRAPPVSTVAKPRFTRRESAPNVFRNSYTRGGKRFELRRWSVRIQYHGKRHTFTLAAHNKPDAIAEANVIYRTVLAHGWEAVRPPTEVAAWPPPAAGSEEAPLASKSLDYWRRRLISRPYLNWARGSKDPELSARIEHAGTWYHFPLGTRMAETAASRARAIYRAILAHGWPQVCSQVTRELTISIFWNASPVACTYTTFLTLPADQIHPSGHLPAWPGPRKRVLLVEPDPTVLRALRFWIDRQRGFECAAAFPSPAAACEATSEVKPDLALLNRTFAGPTGTRTLQWPQHQLRKVPTFDYGIYAESDQIFVSVSGVEAGYVFRRRMPNQLFDPVSSIAHLETVSAPEVHRHISDYFKQLFEPASPPNEERSLHQFTIREEEILNLVSKGSPDKEVAQALGISVWTVRNHLKRVYEKLTVHSRTEAAVKYLQK